MSNNYLYTASNIIREIQYLTLATITPEGHPWNTPVFSAYDSELNFYWSSSLKSQHSKNITNNGLLFIVIYKSVVEQGTGWGVYIKATAELASEDETEKAITLLGKRRNRPFKNKESFLESGTQKIYKATPVAVWINDAKKDKHGEYIEDYRAEMDIPSLIRRLTA